MRWWGSLSTSDIFKKLIAVTCLSLLSAWCKLQNLRHLSTVNCSPNKPAHDKTRKWRAPNKDSDQISLRILTVWSEFSLCAHWVAKDPIRLHADSEHSDQTVWVHRLICVFAGRTDHLVFVVLFHNNYDYVLWIRFVYTSHVTRKPVFRGLRPSACSTAETSQRLEILDLASIGSEQQRRWLDCLDRLICAFVVRIWHKQLFSGCGSYKIKNNTNLVCYGQKQSKSVTEF